MTTCYVDERDNKVEDPFAGFIERPWGQTGRINRQQTQFNSIQVYLYSAFYDTIIAKQLYRKLSFYSIFIYCRNLIYLNLWQNLVILYVV